MDSKKFLSLMKKGKMSRAKIIERLRVGDIYRTDIKGDAKQYMDPELYIVMQRAYDRKKFIKWLKDHSSSLDAKKCPTVVKQAIDDNVITAFDSHILSKLPSDCVDRVTKRETMLNTRKITRKATPVKKKTAVSKKEFDENLLKFIANLDTKPDVGSLAEELKQLGIESGRLNKKKKSTLPSKKKTKNMIRKKSDGSIEDDLKERPAKIGNAPSEFKILMAMKNSNISDKKIADFYERIKGNIPAVVPGKTSVSSGGSSASSKLSKGSSKSSKGSSKLSKGSSKSSKSSRGSADRGSGTVRKAKMEDLELFPLVSTKRRYSSESSGGSPISSRIPVYNIPGMIAFTKRRKRN